MHHRCAKMLDQGAIDWDDFRFVLAIVRGGSVSAAAKQLGVDDATVIRRVDRLERHLSVKLFDRRKTGYLLTEAGPGANSRGGRLHLRDGGALARAVQRDVI